MSRVDERKEERTFSLRQAESAFSAILILGVVRSSLRKGVSRMKITIEVDVSTLILLVLYILALSAIR
jgi:hypothetical protein